MKTIDVISYAFSAIRLRKLRAGLTTLGVIIGIAAIVALLSLGQGFQNAVTVQFEKGFATNTLVVSPRSFGQAVSNFQLHVNDTEALNQIGNVTGSVAVIQRAVYAQKAGIQAFFISVTGVDFAEYETIYSAVFTNASGQIPANPSNDSVIIGARVSEPFQNGTVFLNVGDEINISSGRGIGPNYTAHVAAILNPIGGFGLGGPSDFGIYIPISQAESFFQTDVCDSIVLQLANSDQPTIDYVSNALQNLFDQQVTVTSPIAILDIISSVFSSIELFLAGIAGISLLVAGIGIMNIMIVSLMERTREIGILKALGMKSRTVLTIFLSEAMIIGVLGAVIGIASGYALANVVSRLNIIGNLQGTGGGGLPGGRIAAATGMTIVPALTPTVLLGAFAFGVIVSVVFGLYPAWRASKLKPVEALRYE